MRTRVAGVCLAALLAIGFCGCGGPASVSDADAVKERDKIQGEMGKGNIPTGMPKDALQTGAGYPGMSSEEMAKQGGGAPAGGSTDADRYKKK